MTRDRPWEAVYLELSGLATGDVEYLDSSSADEGEVLSIGGPGWCFVTFGKTADGRRPPNRPVPERDEKQSATSRPVCTKHDRFSIGSKRGIEVLTRVSYRVRERDARAALRRNGPQLTEQIEDNHASVRGKIEGELSALAGLEIDGARAAVLGSTVGLQR